MPADRLTGYPAAQYIQPERCLPTSIPRQRHEGGGTCQSAAHAPVNGAFKRGDDKDSLYHSISVRNRNQRLPLMSIHKCRRCLATRILSIIGPEPG